jgi:hypothetical protein
MKKSKYILPGQVQIPGAGLEKTNGPDQRTVMTRQNKTQANPLVAHENAILIPPDALGDPKSRELARIWDANGTITATIAVPPEYGGPEVWGVVIADVVRFIADAYKRANGIEPQGSIVKIMEMLTAELLSPTAKPGGNFINQS